MSEEVDPAIEASVKENAVLGQLKAFAAGGIGGVCAVLSGHPFDLVKVRQQTAAAGSASSTAMGATRLILANDGLRGLYRGVGAPLVGVTPMFAVSFWGYDVGQQIVRAVSKSDATAKLSIAQISAAGFISAIPMTAITAPFERIKVVLQLQGQGKLAEGERQLKGAGDAAMHIYKKGGLSSLFRGSTATLARDGPGSALYFAAYEYCKRRWADENGNVSLGWIMMAGGTAGVAMWVPVFPIDTIKSNLQSSEVPVSISQVTKNIYARGGLKAFFPGVGPALARSFPANAATFAGVELTHQAFKKFGW
uniref:Mitochondrial Crc1 n=1 Tax=Starmerella bombicola TaxID=75736 RepID=A0A6M8Y3G1_STABO|nr:mitochondrial Crc1 [Starmerella bombicola]